MYQEYALQLYRKSPVLNVVGPGLTDATSKGGLAPSVCAEAQNAAATIDSRAAFCLVVRRLYLLFPPDSYAGINLKFVNVADLTLCPFLSRDPSCKGEPRDNIAKWFAIYRIV
jgi:hypothetical protein